MTQPTCKTCRFYEAGARNAGFCHRYPPTYLTYTTNPESDETGDFSGFPTPGENDWCGEYKPASETF